MNHYKGGRIRLYEALYERYSGLSFSFDTDRSIAIRGLEQKLVHGFNTRGGYGIFEAHLGRGLLWKRGKDYLTKLHYPSNRKGVPTWSWMYYLGRIAYLDLPFAKIEWSRDLESPFPLDQDTKYWTTHELDYVLQVRARAREFEFGEAKRGIIFDTNDHYDPSLLRCVIVGNDKDDRPGENQLHYVLIAKPALDENVNRSEDMRHAYIRVGVGSMERRHIKIDWVPMDVEIF